MTPNFGPRLSTCRVRTKTRRPSKSHLHGCQQSDASRYIPDHLSLFARTIARPRRSVTHDRPGAWCADIIQLTPLNSTIGNARVEHATTLKATRGHRQGSHLERRRMDRALSTTLKCSRRITHDKKIRPPSLNSPCELPRFLDFTITITIQSLGIRLYKNQREIEQISASFGRLHQHTGGPRYGPFFPSFLHVPAVQVN